MHYIILPLTTKRFFAELVVEQLFDCVKNRIVQHKVSVVVFRVDDLNSFVLVDDGIYYIFRR